jgi:hypothetical protein
MSQLKVNLYILSYTHASTRPEPYMRTWIVTPTYNPSINLRENSKNYRNTEVKSFIECFLLRKLLNASSLVVKSFLLSLDRNRATTLKWSFLFICLVIT